jgi:hypothetical protein
MAWQTRRSHLTGYALLLNANLRVMHEMHIASPGIHRNYLGGTDVAGTLPPSHPTHSAGAAIIGKRDRLGLPGWWSRA